MPFYVYGRDPKTGEAAHRFFSEAATEQEARAEGEARGIEVTAVTRDTRTSRVPIDAHEVHAAISAHAHEPQAAIGSARPQQGRAPIDSLPRHTTQAPKHTVRAAASPDVSMTPIRVMPALIGINVLWFAAMAFAGGLTGPDALLSWGASYGPVTIGHQWWRLLTASFVHVGVIDLVVHMAALVYAGWVAERQFGSIAALLIYLIAGVGGNLIAQQADMLDVVSSATAPVCGCIGALLALTLWHRGEIDAEVPRACMTIGFVAVFLIAEFGFELSFAALVGGLICGFVAGLALSPSGADETDGAKFVWTAAVAALVLCAAGAWVRARNHGLSGTLEVLNAAEALDRRVAAQLQQARSDWQSCRSQAADVTTVIQRDILPDWRAVRVRLEQIAPYPASIAGDVAKRIDAMKRREAGLDTPSPSGQWSPDVGSPRQRGDC